MALDQFFQFLFQTMTPMSGSISYENLSKEAVEAAEAELEFSILFPEAAVVFWSSFCSKKPNSELGLPLHNSRVGFKWGVGVEQVDEDELSSVSRSSHIPEVNSKPEVPQVPRIPEQEKESTGVASVAAASCFSVELRLEFEFAVKRGSSFNNKGGTWHIEVVKKAIFSWNMCLSSSPGPSLAFLSLWISRPVFLIIFSNWRSSLLLDCSWSIWKKKHNIHILIICST